MEKIKYIKSKDNDGNSRLNLRKIGKGVALSTTVCIVLLLVAAVLLTYTNMSISIANLISNSVFYIGAFLSGVISSYGLKADGWLHGIISGTIYFLIIWMAAFLANVTDEQLVFQFLKIVLSVVSGATGGIAGVNIRPKKNSRR